jgi:uncharacterized protein (TIGR01777 family)
MAQKWTEAYKKELVNSRIQSARTLGNALAKAAKRKRYWIQASGIGYYPHSNELMTEESPRGRDFLAGLCDDWERAAEQFRNEDLKVAVVRIGVVLKKGEGFLGKLVPLAKWGLSSAFGDGKQHLSWIHIHDLCGIVNFLAEKQPEGIFNAVSDEPVSNRDMTAAIARSVDRPFFLPAVPKKALTLLMGEMGEELLANHRVSNNKLKKAGYTFEYPGLREALRETIDRKP